MAKGFYMAIQDVILRLKMIADGTQQEVNNSERIAQNYANANTSAKELNASKARSAAMAGSRSPRETVEYGMARGAAGATGASGRDFANQAQGLGGLVRLYATYAANIFAVEAAFRALSSAMNTENMIKGLDQLGAASGRSLGGLSKQLVDVTGGAVSLREAMDTVAKSSAAGMSSQNILRMGEAAQKASQVLGVNMTDALNRISRGVTKLEPELLDELGIFVKIEDASEKYARQLGKTAGSLTEFERRQAFANEVLTQAETKFGKIKIEANPYDKLAASLANLSQQGLSVLNVFLVPFIDALSKSPVALTTAIAALGGMIIKQAIPAVTQYKEYLDKVRQSTLAAVSQNSKEFKLAQLSSLQNAEKEARHRADISIEMADYAQSEIEKLAKSGALKDKKRIQELAEISKRSATEVTDQQLAYLDRMAKKNMANNRELGMAYRNYAEALRVAREEESNRIVNNAKAVQAAEALKNIKEKTLDTDKKFLALTKESAIASAKAAVSEATKNEGLISGLRQVGTEYKKLREGVTQKVGTGQFQIIDGKKVEKTAEIVTKQFGILEGAATALGLVFSSIATKTITLISSILRIGTIVGAITVGLQLLRGLFTNTREEEEKFSKSSEILESSLKNVGNTLEYLQDLKPDKLFSVESVQARANAFNDLSDSLAKSTSRVEELNNKSEGVLDTLVNGYKYLFGDIIGGGLESTGRGWEKNESTVVSVLGTITKYSGKLFSFLSGGGTYINQYTKDLSDSIVKAVAISQGPAREKLKETLGNILGADIDFSDVDAVRNKLAEIGDTSFDKLISNGQKVSDTIAKISRDANNTATSLTSLQESIKTLTKDVTDFNNKLLPSDGLGKIGVDLLDVNSKFFNVLTDNKQQLLGIKEVITNIQALSLLPGGLVQNIVGDRQEIIATGEEIVKIQKEIDKLEQQKVKSKSAEERASLSKSIADLGPKLAAAEAKASEFVQKYSQQLSFGLFEAGVRKLDESLKLSFREAALIGGKSLLSIIQAGGGRTAELEASLAKEELAIQKELIQAQFESRLATDRLNQSLQQKITQDEIIRKEGQMVSGVAGGKKLSYDDKVQLQKEIDQLTERATVEGIKGKILADPTKRAFDELAKKAKGGDGAEADLAAQKALVELSNTYAALRGKQAAEAIIDAKSQSAEVERQLKAKREDIALLDKRADRQLRANALEQQYASLVQSAMGINSNVVLQRQEQLDLQSTSLNYEKESRRLNFELENLTRGKTELEAKGVLNADQKRQLEKTTKDIVEKQSEIQQSSAAKSIADELTRFKYAVERLKLAEQLRKLQRDTDTEQINNLIQIRTSTLDFQSQILDYQMKLNDGDNKSLILAKQRIETEKLNLEYQSQLVQFSERQAQIRDRATLRAGLKAQGVSSEELENFDKVTQLQQTSLNQQVESSNILYKIKQDNLKLTQQQAIEEERIRFLLQESQQLSAALGGAFGKFGEKLGSAATTLTEIGTQIEKNAKLELSLRTKIQDIESSGDVARAEDYQQLADVQAKNARDEISYNTKVLASSKNLFKEKTAAFKLFSGLEKAYHIVRIAMAAKELATMIANTVTFVTTSLTRQATAATEAGVLGVKAVVNSMSTLPPPFSFAAGAAMTAIVATLLGSIGKTFKGSSNKGPSTAQKEESFGTAMGYDSSGNKVQVRQGVLGFPDEKINSITKNIETITRYTDDGLIYDNKILDTLKSIDNGINGLTVGIFKAQGITTGSIASGVKYGGFIGSTGLNTAITGLGTGVGYAAGAALAGGGLASMGAAGYAADAFLSSILGPMLDLAFPVIGTLVGLAIGKLLNTKVTPRIDESGIALRGSFDTLADDTAKGVTAFAKVTFKASNIFDKWTAGVEEIFPSLEDTPGGKTVVNQVQGIFKDTRQLFYSLAEGYGRTVDDVNTVLKGLDPVDLKLNLKDMDAKAAAEKLSVAISAFIDDAAQALFGEAFTKFIKTGETLTDAVIRTITQQQVIQAQLRATAITGTQITKDLAGIDLANTISEAFGGLEKFSDSIRYFRENFLTDTEKVTAAQGMLTERLKALGYESINSTEKFKQLIQGFKVTGPESAKLYANLLALESSIIQVYGPIIDTAEILKTLNAEIVDLSDTSTDLDKALADIKTKSLDYIDKLNQTGKATAENIEIIARWAKLSTLKELRAQLKTTFEDRKRELESSINSLEKIKTTLVDFKNQLLVGDLSPLSQIDQFKQLKTEYDQLLLDVKSSDSEVANKAAEAFPQLSTQLLNTAKTLYGSSDLYKTFSDLVLKDLDTVQGIVNTKLDTDKLTYDELIKQGQTLGFIQTSTATTAEKLTALLIAYNAVNKIDTAAVGATAATSIQQGMTSSSSLLNAWTQQLSTSMAEVKIVPLELTPEAKAAKAAADAAAAKAAAKAAADAAALKAAIDAQTAILAKVTVDTTDDLVEVITKTAKVIPAQGGSIGSFGIVSEKEN